MQDRGQSGEQQQPGDQPGWGQQPQYTQYTPYTQQMGGPTPNGGGNGRKNVGKGLGLGCLGLIVIVVIAAIASAGKSGGSSATSASTPTTVVWSSATAVSTQQAVATQAAPTSAAPTTPDVEQVTFKCTGSTDGNGIDITYGAEGTNDSASSLPFTKTVQLSTTAQYYDVTAQLQGGGNVSCTTTVQSGGQTVIQTGSASGDYNIASAEVCSSFDGGWDAC
jgi:hypothetical protein